MGKSDIVQMRPITSLQRLILNVQMVGNGGCDDAFCLKLSTLTARDRGSNGRIVVLLRGLGCCKVLFGSQKKKRNFEGFWDAVYITVDGKRAHLESSSVFLLVS